VLSLGVGVEGLGLRVRKMVYQMDDLSLGQAGAGKGKVSGL
jgi:hypothetical protein